MREKETSARDFLPGFVVLQSSEYTQPHIPTDEEVQNDPNFITRLQLGLELLYRLDPMGLLRNRNGEKMLFLTFLEVMTKAALDMNDEPMAHGFSLIQEQFETNQHRFLPDFCLN